MNRLTKAVLLFAAKNLEDRAVNSRRSAKTWSGEAEAFEKAAWAFDVSADYLRGLTQGFGDLPTHAELLAKFGGAS